MSGTGLGDALRATRLLGAVAAAAVLAAGCGESAKVAAPAAESPSCPKAWTAGWQQLADDVGAIVYCPTWMPYPVDGQIGGRYRNGRWVDKDKNYLVSFLWVDRDAGISQEVHINFRGYPGSTAIPTCEETLTVDGKTTRNDVPCFSDSRGQKKVGDVDATVYTVNQGIDAWHVLYAWKHDGSLYTVSQHVAPPYSYARVVRNLEQIVRTMAPVQPAA